MKKVRLFVCADMTVIDTNEGVYKNFLSYDYKCVIANVVSIKKHEINFGDGDVLIVYDIQTDYCNPHRTTCSKFSLPQDIFEKVQWVE